MSSKIHPTAIVDSAAKIGIEVEIGPYSVIGPHVELGDRTRVAPHVVIEGRTTLGPDCTVFQFASIGAAPQDLKFKGEPSTLVIGSRNTIREYVTLQPGTASGHMTTVIGDNNLFMANSHVGHDCKVGNNNVFSNAVGLAGHVTIGNNAILGGMAGIHQFTRVGDFALIGAGAMVGADVPHFCIAQGDRAHLRGVNVIGLKRAGFSAQDISEIRKLYRALFATTGRLEEKLAQIPAELAERPLAQKMAAFLRESQRGVCFPYKQLGGSAEEDLS